MGFAGAVPGMPGAMIHEVADLPEVLAGAVHYAPYSQAMPGAFQLNLPDVARFRVTGGMLIEIAALPGAAGDDIRLFLGGAVRSALIHQRGELPLHASAMIPPGGGGAVAIAGHSGAGKSTLAAELSRRGWRLVADDLTRITVEDGRPMAWPGGGAIKLWEDACAAQDIATGALAPVRDGMRKFYLPCAIGTEPVRLAAIAVLDQSPGPALETPSLGEAMALVSQNALRPRQIAPLGQAAAHARIVAAVVGACPVRRLTGARIAPVAALADLLEGLARDPVQGLAR